MITTRKMKKAAAIFKEKGEKINFLTLDASWEKIKTVKFFLPNVKLPSPAQNPTWVSLVDFFDNPDAHSFGFPKAFPFTMKFAFMSSFISFCL